MSQKCLFSFLSESKIAIQPNKEIILHKFEKICLYFVMKSEISKK